MTYPAVVGTGDALAAAAAAPLRDIPYERIRKERTHLYQISESVSSEGRWRCEYGILLPFSEDGGTVARILVYSLACSSRDG